MNPRRPEPFSPLLPEPRPYQLPIDDPPTGCTAVLVVVTLWAGVLAALFYLLR